MDESSQVSSGDLDKEQADRSQANRENLKENISSSQPGDDWSGRGQPTVDIAEVLRRWTHALQRIHKQSLHLVFFYIICTYLSYFCNNNCYYG